ncbi:ubiquitin-conjugating enzyme/RWD-like protein [Glomus cerebriforme]|uniref:Ubiquitin-conjugating enzyme/RWD-like protein n=1 Tax=Glomus cerebriforme TaxID=658196 RepID=A0A397SD81_9GLOM|nr:ubiquitin-conjugating enzyme/RWD-like protein [Glomus cerebriforme]
MDNNISTNLTELERTCKRIEKEMRNIGLNRTIRAGPIVDHDIFRWMATLFGPSGSPYSGGVFFLDIRLPANYPWKPPKINFTTKIYHLNVDSSGKIHMDPLDFFQWTPTITISKLISVISSLLITPNPDIESSPEIAHIFKTDRTRYENTAREWTTKYATKL